MPDDDSVEDEARERPQLHIQILPSSDWAAFADSINRRRGWPVS